MTKSVLRSSKVFWFFMAFLFSIGIMVVYLIVKMTIEKGGTFSDIPAYVYFPFLLTVLDISRRISFYLRHRTDQLVVKGGELTLLRNGIKRTFRPNQLKKIRKNHGAGFLDLETIGGVNYRLQPWLFGKTMWQLISVLKDNGFDHISR